MPRRLPGHFSPIRYFHHERISRSSMRHYDVTSFFFFSGQRHAVIAYAIMPFHDIV